MQFGLGNDLESLYPLGGFGGPRGILTLNSINLTK